MKNKNLLITGAATRVGKAIALHFAERGWNIALHYFKSSSKARNLKKIIEQNYSHLMPDFFEMQTKYLASLNIIYNDLDASLVAMVLTSQIYKNKANKTNSKDKISIKYFYQKENFTLPVSTFKIKEISLMLNLPRETVRRKKEKLIKDKLIILDKKIYNIYK